MKPFYGKEIDPQTEKQVIEKILDKYRSHSPSEDLKKIIYRELMEAKQHGLITIPFKVVLRRSCFGHRQHYIEIILDTKV